MKGSTMAILLLALGFAYVERNKITSFIHQQVGGKQAAYSNAYLGQGGINMMPLYFSGQAMAGPSTLGPGGAGRSTMPGVLSNNGFKGTRLNRFGR